MNTTHLGLVALLRSAITGEKLSLPDGFSLEEADSIISGQGLVPLAYVGAKNCGISLKTELMQRYKMQYGRIMLQSERQMEAVKKLLAAFEEHGIDYLPLKGCVMKPLYPQPEMRMMGDADILIRLEQYDRIKPVMQMLKYEYVKESSYDIPWKNDALYVELHKCLIPPHEKDLYAYFGTGWEKAVKDTGYRYDLTKEDTYVHIFTHMTKHFRFMGIGARQIVDLYVYRKAFPNMDEKLVEQAMEQLHLKEFHRNILRLLAVWFEGQPTDELTDFITAYIFSGGNWGLKKNKFYSEALLDSRSSGKVKNSRWKSLGAALFPSLYLMQSSYPVLLKYPVLYPVYWVVRWVEVVLRRPKNILWKLGLVRGTTDEKITDYQQTLNYMGLDFHYEDGEQES